MLTFGNSFNVKQYKTNTNTGKPTILPSFDDIPDFSNGLTSKFIMRVVEVLSFTFCSSTHVLFLLLSCSLVALGWGYKNCLKNQCTGNIALGLEEYYKLKNKILLLSATWGGKYIAFYFAVICYYGALPDHILGYQKQDSSITLVTYCAINVLVWLLAAEFHDIVRKINDSFKKGSEWL